MCREGRGSRGGEPRVFSQGEGSHSWGEGRASGPWAGQPLAVLPRLRLGRPCLEEAGAAGQGHGVVLEVSRHGGGNVPVLEKGAAKGEGEEAGRGGREASWMSIDVL